MDNEIEYTEPVEFTLAGAADEPLVTITWDPEKGLSAGDGFKDGLALLTLEAFIDTYELEYGQSYSVTPEGPTLKTSTKDIYMVSWAISQIFDGGVVSASAPYPTLKDMGLGPASMYDENGNEIIR